MASEDEVHSTRFSPPCAILLCKHDTCPTGFNFWILDLPGKAVFPRASFPELSSAVCVYFPSRHAVPSFCNVLRHAGEQDELFKDGVNFVRSFNMQFCKKVKFHLEISKGNPHEKKYVYHG